MAAGIRHHRIDSSTHRETSFDFISALRQSTAIELINPVAAVEKRTDLLGVSQTDSACSRSIIAS